MSCIYVNGRFLTQPITGISRFAYEICKELSKIIKLTIIVPKNSIQSSYDITGLNIVEFGRLKSHFWEQISLPLFLRNKKNYILLNLSGLGPVICKSKITTIHDVSFLYNPKWFSLPYYIFYKTVTPLIINTSLHLLTVSEFSKAEILKYYRCDSDKISIIYNAVDFSFFKESKDISHPQLNSFLTVGSIDPRKNLVRLIKAFQNPILKDYELRIIGSKNKIFNDTHLNESILVNDNIRFLGRLSDSEMINEYKKTSLFISASLYEGFGIPPLEALTLGCNVAVSDIPVYHEVFNEAVHYINPKNENEMAKDIIRAFKSGKGHKTTIIDFITNKYSWTKSALELKKIIEKFNSYI